MRKIDFREWQNQRKRVFGLRIKAENSFTGPAVGRRPRDPDKERVLTELDIARRKRYLQTGKLEILGPRKWRWRIDFKSRQ